MVLHMLGGSTLLYKILSSFVILFGVLTKHTGSSSHFGVSVAAQQTGPAQ